MKSERTRGPKRSSGHHLLPRSRWESGTETEPCWDAPLSPAPGGPGTSGTELPVPSEAMGGFSVQVEGGPSPKYQGPGQPSSFIHMPLSPDYCSSHWDVQIVSWQPWSFSHLCQLQPQGLAQITSLWLRNALITNSWVWHSKPYPLQY